AGGARHHGEGRACANLHDRPAPIGGRDGLDREGSPALGRTLRRIGQGCRGIETEGEGRWTQEERGKPHRSRNALLWNESPSASSSSRELSTVRRALCSRRGPSPSCSSSGGRRSRWACSCVPARWMFVSGAGTVWCSATMPQTLPSSSVGISK